MNVPFADLSAQYRSIKPAIDAAIQNVIDSAQFIQGESVRAFEERFASYHQSKHCVAVGSGTDALHLSLWAMGIGKGDLVLTTPFTFIATVEAIMLTGAKPVFADIRSDTYTLDPERVATCLKDLDSVAGTKVILPVHLYGQPAIMKDLCDVAAQFGAAILEDAAQAHGAKYSGTFVGNFGRAGTFSFYPVKNLGAFGEAGAVTTNDDELATLMRRVRDHGQVEKYRHSHLGHNYRMDGIQGAVLGVKMGQLDGWIRRRREIAAQYSAELRGIGDIIPPIESPGAYHVYHLYVIRTAQRDRLREHLTKRGIATALHYPIPLHLQEALRFLGHKPGDFPVSEQASRDCLALPLYPELTPQQIDYVLSEVKALYK